MKPVSRQALIILRGDGNDPAARADSFVVERVLQLNPRMTTMVFKLIELALVAGAGTYIWKKLVRHWAETGKRW